MTVLLNSAWNRLFYKRGRHCYLKINGRQIFKSCSIVFWNIQNETYIISEMLLAKRIIYVIKYIGVDKKV